MKSVFLWCIFASACYAVLVTCSEEESFDIGSILDNIPVEGELLFKYKQTLLIHTFLRIDRIGFLKYHLEIGYNLTKTGNTSDARDMVRSEAKFLLYTIY